jgi:hypothetical protein
MNGPLLLALSDGSPRNLSIFDPVSPPAESIHYLSLLVLAITAGILLVVEGVLIYSLLRFRHPRSAAAPGGQDARAPEPPQVYGSKPIEIAWTAAPALIVFVLTLVIARTEWEVRVDPIIRRRNSKTASRCASASSAISGGGNSTTKATVTRNSISSRPTNCMCRRAIAPRWPARRRSRRGGRCF